MIHENLIVSRGKQPLHLDQLPAMAIFVRVVELGGFTAAAEDLGLSKSQVSKQITRLEDRLGTRLLNRTTRRLSLTEAGTVFFERCQEVVSAAEAADSAVSHLAEAPRGVLRVNAPVSFGNLHVTPALHEFMTRCPDLRIELSLNDRRVDLVEEGYDVGIRIGKLHDSSLVARLLARNKRILVAAPSYLAHHGAPASLEDLRDHSCLIYAYQESGQVWAMTGPDGERKVKVDGRLRTNNGDAIAVAAGSGLGIAFLPDFIVQTWLDSGRLVRVLPDWADGEDSPIHAIFPASRNLSPKVRVFVDFLVERFRGLDSGSPQS